MYRLPVIFLLLVHAAFFVVRIPLAGALPLPTDFGELRVGWGTFTIFEAVFFAFFMAYLLGAMARERVVLRYKQASLTDPLTGVGNRRAFFERGEKLLHRSAFEGRPAALLLFDLDRFKDINDTFGHHVGDRVLKAFCGVATAALRPDDLFSRVGGEEFASLFLTPRSTRRSQIAERIRSNFAASMPEVGANTLRATVSVGLAMSIDPSWNFADIFEEPIGRSIVPRQTGATVSNMRVAYRRITHQIDGSRAWMDSSLANRQSESHTLEDGSRPLVWRNGAATDVSKPWSRSVLNWPGTCIVWPARSAKQSISAAVIF